MGNPISGLGDELTKLRKVAKAADSVQACIAEFGDLKYCGEWLSALDDALAALKSIQVGLPQPGDNRESGNAGAPELKPADYNSGNRSESAPASNTSKANEAENAEAIRHAGGFVSGEYEHLERERARMLAAQSQTVEQKPQQERYREAAALIEKWSKEPSDYDERTVEAADAFATHDRMRFNEWGTRRTAFLLGVTWGLRKVAPAVYQKDDQGKKMTELEKRNHLEDMARMKRIEDRLLALMVERGHERPQLQDYIEACGREHVIDHAIRMEVLNTFYIHPALVSGPTLNFFLAADGQVINTNEEWQERAKATRPVTPEGDKNG